MGHVTNMVNLAVGDLATSYDLSGGPVVFKKPVRGNIAYTMQFIWVGVNALDTVCTIKGSNNNVDFEDYLAPTSVTLDAANGSKALTTKYFTYDHIAVDVNPNLTTAGTLIILMKQNPA